MEDATVLAWLALYAMVVLGFVFLVARDPPRWAEGPRRMTVWIVVGLVVAGPFGALWVLWVARHASRRARLLQERDMAEHQA